MRASEYLIEALKKFEGCKLKAYKDAGYGVWTIGFGHTGSDVKRTTVITMSKAEELLKRDLAKFEYYVNGLGCVTQGQFDALVDFAFNCGISALQTSTLLKKIKAGTSEEEIRYQFSRWNKAKGKVLPGLVKRREWEANRFFEK